MLKNPYCVFVVIEQEYGADLLNLVSRGPIWAVDTPANRRAAQNCWLTSENSHLEGIAVFNLASDVSPEDTLIGEIDTIDLHHGIHSADSPCTILEVIGTTITERIKQELAHYGYNEFEATYAGFRATRPRPTVSD